MLAQGPNRKPEKVMYSELETKNAYSFYLLERVWFTQMFLK